MLVLSVLLICSWTFQLSLCKDQTDIFSWISEANHTKRNVWNESRAVASGIYVKSQGGLTNGDRELLTSLYSKADSIFEFGTGESTSIAAFLNVSRYTGVDSDMAWLQKVAAVSPSHFRFHLADIGRIIAWGNPADPDSFPKWPFYSIGALAPEREAFDFYMVDGRFRVACVCAAFLHASRCGRDPSTFLVGIHDFRARHHNSPIGYHKLKQFVQHVAGFNHLTPVSKHSHGTGPDSYQLAVFRRREGVTDKELFDLWHEFKYVKQ